MKIFSAVCILCVALFIHSPGLLADQRGIVNTSSSPFAKMRSVDIDAVKWTDGFWADRFDNCHDVMIPHMWGVLSDPYISHVWQNFRIAAGLDKGEFKGTWWEDGDFYKWFESIAFAYAVTKEESLNQLMDKVVDVIARAQQEDGYLHTSIIIGHGIRTYRPWLADQPFAGKTTRFETLRDHELYNMGHLMSAGCIHHRASGKTTLLDVAKNTGDFLYRVFKTGDPRLAHFGFNPSNIMGAVELYRTTGDEKYLELANIFIDMRGSEPDGNDNNQTRTPLRDETKAVGHYVTGPYLWAGAADVYAETGDKSLLDAIERIWWDAELKKTYIMGGAGAVHHGESLAGDKVSQAYGHDYELHNATAYNETCAPISDLMWTWRMLGITGDARYADRVERILFNSALSGISLDGKLYRRTQPLTHFGQAEPKPPQTDDNPSFVQHLVSFCCPTQVIRTIAKAHAMTYSLSDNGIYVHFYGGNVFKSLLSDGTAVQLVQETEYPWAGDVKIVVSLKEKKEFSILLRIPGWTEGAVVAVNGEEMDLRNKPGTYAEIDRLWSDGDIIDLQLPMVVQLIEAHPLVEANRNQVAIQRGPLVYCLESTDLPNDIGILDVVIPADVDFTTDFKPYLLNGVTVLEGDVKIVKDETQGWTDSEGVAPPGKEKQQKPRALYRELGRVKETTKKIRMIPYFVWGNRGISDMTVWLPVDL